MSDSLPVAHPMLARLALLLRAHPGERVPAETGLIRAAVAILFAVPARGAPELLLIKRADREGDPWSGHVALPGGRWDPTDRSLEETAVRETREETGLDISSDGTLFGTLDDLRPRSPSLPPVVVTPFVGMVRHGMPMTPSDEVAEAFWVPWSRLQESGVQRDSIVTLHGRPVAVPSYVLGRHMIWGMTERILDQLVRRMREADGP